MKSKRAAAASTEDFIPVDGSVDKKRKRTDDDGAPSHSVKKYKQGIKEKRERKKEKKEKKKAEKEEKEAKKPKKDKSKYNNKTRKEKKDERKNIQDLPEDVNADESSERGAAIAEPVVNQPEAKTNGDAIQDKKDKKGKKEKKKAEKPETSASKDVPQGEDAIDLDASTATKPGRNIVFVGNLPYTATAATITAHFASLKPVAVRCLTKKEDPKVCRGIAFIEFSSPAHQRTCLDKFHHSMFEDGVSEPRRINVELT